MAQYRAVFKKPGHPDRWLTGNSSAPLIRSKSLGEGYEFAELYEYLVADMSFCEQELRWKIGNRRWFLVLRAEQTGEPREEVPRSVLSRANIRARG